MARLDLIPADLETPALELWRSGAPATAIHTALWPDGDAPIPARDLEQVLAALDVARAVELPPDDLPTELDAAVTDLKESRDALMQTIRDYPADPRPHLALSKNVTALLAVEKFRLDRQTHRHNMTVLADRRRDELADRLPRRKRDPYATA